MIAGLHVRYCMQPCLGNLVFSHYEHVPFKDKKTNKVIRTFKKTIFKCDKCGDLVSVILMPSYEQYILMGKIRVSKEEYYNVRDRYRGG